MGRWCVWCSGVGRGGEVLWDSERGVLTLRVAGVFGGGLCLELGPVVVLVGDGGGDGWGRW